MQSIQTKGRPREGRFVRDAESPELDKPLCLIYGNCQAEALRILLAESQPLGSTFRTLRIPAVHEITDSELAMLQKDVLPQASLLISQRVRSGYRDRALGSEEIAEWTPDDCTVVRIPDLIYRGLFPFQVKIDLPDSLAPLTTFHDARFMFCASMGWDATTASDWLADYIPPAEALRRIAAESATAFRNREALLDVQVAARVTRASALTRTFHLVHHPTNQTLLEVVRGIHDVLELPFVPRTVDQELLGTFQTPLEPGVIAALGLDLTPVRTWTIDGKPYSIEALMAIHLAWYRDNPAVLESGLLVHAERMAVLGLHH